MQKQNVITNKPIARTLYLLLLCCLCIPLLTSCESRNAIVNRLDEKEANEIIVFLSTKGIEAIKEQSADSGGAGAQKQILWDVTVSAEQTTRAMSILNQSGLPRRRGQTLLGIFSDVGLVPSEMQERIRYQAGLAEQIASTIRKIDGILDSEVQISFPEDDPLNPGKKKGEITSSVYIKHSGVLDDPNTHLITKIKRLVSASVTGLKYDNVTIIPDRARFSDFPIGLQAIREEEKEFVKTWTIIVAKESLTRFRMIFFILTVGLLILLLAFIWIGWKTYPILKQHGGLPSLFSLAPLVEEAKREEEEVVEEEEEGAEGEEEEGKEEEEKEEGSPADVT
ncbi:MAG: Nodulation protein NolT [Chlamydiae bacterium]|nr:Nodulation protein NolT [Chlamydiota bacterium]